MSASLPAEWISHTEGLPRLDMIAVHAMLDDTGARGHTRAADLTHIASAYLELLAAALSPAYSVLESGSVLLLSSLGRRAPEILDGLDALRRRIEVELPGLACFEPEDEGKLAILVLNGEDAYYRYLTPFGRRNVQAKSGGVFIRSPYAHVVCLTDEHSRYLSRTLAHELVHAGLRHRHLPLWLEEGVVALIEGMPSAPERTRLAEDRPYWNADTIQGFWTGAAFNDLRGQRPSYGLARVLVELVATDILDGDRERLVSWVAACSPDDAGAEATRMHLEHDLADVVATFLGPGDWAPRPASWDLDTYDEPDVAVLYPYVGSETFDDDAVPLGWEVRQPADLRAWAHEQYDLEPDDDDAVTVTFVVDAAGELMIAPRRSEHCDCAGGRPVRAAGELTFTLAPTPVVVRATNQSTGYRPDAACWAALERALRSAGLHPPAGFDRVYAYRR